MSKVEKESINKTKIWLESFVIGHNLCPFAKFPFQQEIIRYVVSQSNDASNNLEVIRDELRLIEETDPSVVETTLIILTEGFHEFLDYLDLLDRAQKELISAKLEGIIQIASFHPRYQFADLDHTDVRNYTNRSPYPMIHLLREDSVTKAVDTYPNIDQIPNINQKKLLKLGLDYFNH